MERKVGDMEYAESIDDDDDGGFVDHDNVPRTRLANPFTSARAKGRTEECFMLCIKLAGLGAAAVGKHDKQHRLAKEPQLDPIFLHPLNPNSKKIIRGRWEIMGEWVRYVT